jgi:hypothetical protein
MSSFPPAFRHPFFYNTLDKARQDSPLDVTVQLDPTPTRDGTRRVRIRVYALREVGYISTEITIPHERNWNAQGYKGTKWIRKSVPDSGTLNSQISILLHKIFTVYRSYPGISVSQTIALVNLATPDEIKQISAQDDIAYKVPSREEILARAQLQLLTESIKKLERKLKKLKRQR